MEEKSTSLFFRVKKCPRVMSSWRILSVRERSVQVTSMCPLKPCMISNSVLAVTAS
jgi:hypothetical protein